MQRFYAFLFVIGVLLLVGCAVETDTDSREPTPTAPEPTQTVTITPTPVATLLPSSTFPPTLTPSLIPTLAPPSDTPLPPPTPGPFEYTIQAGDDCLSILMKHGHRTPDALAQFYELNHLPGQCVLPGPGAVVLVPRPSVEGGILVPSPTPPVPWSSGLYVVTQYCAVEGDTLTSIALKNDTTLRKVCELNPLPDGLDCTGCDFSASDVGSCPRPPLISVGRCINVPGATPTPSNTPLSRGDETATPTPTHTAPTILNPADGATVSGRVRLQWVSVGLLLPDEFYVARLLNETTGELFSEETKVTSLLIPEVFLQPRAEPQNLIWFVSVEVRTENGLLVPVGGRSPDYRFSWR